MRIKTRKRYPSALKAKIVLEVLRENRMVSELAAEHQIHPNLVTKWKQSAIAKLPTLSDSSERRINRRVTRVVVAGQVAP